MNNLIKTIAVSLSVIILTLCVTSGITYALTNPETGLVLYCVDDAELLYSENADVVTAPASLTKLLTAATALRYISSDTVLTVGTELELADPKSSVCLILKGHRLKLYDLITGMLMASGNDAAYTVAVSVARIVNPETEMSDTEAVGYFCTLMNDLAQELEMTNSRFVTPDGWDSEDQYTTPSDLLKLAVYCISIPEIREIASTFQKYVVFESGENITWTNTNKMLDPDSKFYSSNAVGMKTGTTKKAWNCLIAAFEKEGKTYISVVTGCKTDSDRYRRTLKLEQLI